MLLTRDPRYGILQVDGLVSILVCRCSRTNPTSSRLGNLSLPPIDQLSCMLSRDKLYLSLVGAERNCHSCCSAMGFDTGSKHAECSRCISGRRTLSERLDCAPSDSGVHLTWRAAARITSSSPVSFSATSRKRSISSSADDMTDVILL